jgi:hypothetical protein
LYVPGTGWTSYTPLHWVPFSSPPTTRRATVEVFEPYSIRGGKMLIMTWRKHKFMRWNRQQRLFQNAVTTVKRNTSIVAMVVIIRNGTHKNHGRPIPTRITKTVLHIVKVFFTAVRRSREHSEFHTRKNASANSVHSSTYISLPVHVAVVVVVVVVIPAAIKFHVR